MENAARFCSLPVADWYNSYVAGCEGASESPDNRVMCRYGCKFWGLQDYNCRRILNTKCIDVPMTQSCMAGPLVCDPDQSEYDCFYEACNPPLGDIEVTVGSSDGNTKEVAVGRH